MIVSDVMGSRFTMADAGMRFEGPAKLETQDGRPVLRGALRITTAIAILPFLQVRVEGPGGAVADSNSRGLLHLGWLPRGVYRFDIVLPQPFPAGDARYVLDAGFREAMNDDRVADQVLIANEQ